MIFKFFSTLGDSLVLRNKLTITGQDGGQGSGSRDGQNEVVCPGRRKRSGRTWCRERARVGCQLHAHLPVLVPLFLSWFIIS